MTIDENAIVVGIAAFNTTHGHLTQRLRAAFLAYEAAKPVPASGGVEAAGWLYDQEVGSVFSTRWATKWIERQPGETRGVRNIRQVFTLASSTPPSTAPDVGMVEAVREALLGYVLKPGQYETASAFARGQNRVAIDMLGVLDEAAALSPAPVATSTSGTRSDALANLISVLCDPDGRVCIEGSDGDRAAVKASLETLAEVLK